MSNNKSLKNIDILDAVDWFDVLATGQQLQEIAHFVLTNCDILEEELAKPKKQQNKELLQQFSIHMGNLIDDTDDMKEHSESVDSLFDELELGQYL